MKLTRYGLRLTTAVLAAALWHAPALFAQDYEIHLHRPDSVGSKFHLSAVGKTSTSQILKQGDKVLQNESSKFSVQAELVVTVNAVSERGRITKATAEVEKLTRTDGEATTELAPKGSIITASLNENEPQFEMKGVAMKPEAQESLRLIDLVAADPNGPTDDEVFGAKDRKKVGDSWEVNSALMAEDLSRHGLGMKKEDLKGSVTLDKLVKLDNTDCLQLSGVVTCDTFTPPLPPRITADKSSLKLSLGIKLPITGAPAPCETSSDMAMTFVARGKPDPNGGEAVLEMTSEESVVDRTTPVR